MGKLYEVSSPKWQDLSFEIREIRLLFCSNFAYFVRRGSEECALEQPRILRRIRRRSEGERKQAILSCLELPFQTGFRQNQRAIDVGMGFERNQLKSVR
jgi:hypothetical protein